MSDAAHVRAARSSAFSSSRPRPPLPNGPRSRVPSRINPAVPVLRTQPSCISEDTNTTCIDSQATTVSSHTSGATTPAVPEPDAKADEASGAPKLDTFTEDDIRAFLESRARTFHHKYTQTDDPTPTPSTSRASTIPVPKSPALPPPPTLDFSPPPIAWRAVTLDAAQWTWSSAQLQAVVARAIRISGRESFIRLISASTAEELDAEVARLDSLRAATQTQLRFNQHRRTMLLQSLSVLATDVSGDGPLAELVAQLAEVTAASDRLTETLLRVADQRAQIQRLQDVHVASALAIGLRKLNKSYAKRLAELERVQGLVEELRAEAAEAWMVAESIAQEVDELDNFDMWPGDEAVGVMGEASGSQVPRLRSVKRSVGASTMSPTATSPSEATTPGAGEPASADMRGRERKSRVLAAKKRSHRVSKASLRVRKEPTTPARSRSRSKSVVRARSVDAEHRPPVPTLGNISHRHSGSFLEMGSDTRPVSPEPPHALPPASAPLVPTTFSSVEVPADTLNYADDDSSYRSHVRSLQNKRASRFSDDTTIGVRRTLSDYVKLNDWLCMGGKATERLLLPLTSILSPRTRREDVQNIISNTS